MNNKIVLALLGFATVQADLGDPVEVPPYQREGWPAQHETTAVNTQKMIKDHE